MPFPNIFSGRSYLILACVTSFVGDKSMADESMAHGALCAYMRIRAYIYRIHKLGNFEISEKKKPV